MNEKQDQVKFDKLRTEHIPKVAELHIMGIKEGFFGSLGNEFVCCLYQAIIESDQAFGFVAIKDGEVLGFISCAENLRGVYKHIIKKNFCKLAWAMLPKMFRWYNIKNTIAAFLYPSKTGKELPSAEILSIVVDSRLRRMGVGRRLIELSHDEFRRRAVKWVKVITAEDQHADEFYKTVGFKLTAHSQKRGVLLSIYVMKVSDD
jgi:ribosomal protein S18 acetylase RimI-like enzyme